MEARMIEKLLIKNFQRHELFKLSLSKHITTIVGASDKGKSSVIRALRVVCLNKPSGNSVIRHGQSHTKICLQFDGKTLLRIRGKSKNVYKLDSRKFVSFGSGVPDEISNILNLSEDNFGLQLSAPFWLNLSPGEAAKRLNSIIHLELIDISLANIGKQVRQAKSKVELTEERLEEANKSVDSLKWVTKADDALKGVEGLGKNAISLRDKSSRLSGLLEEVSKAGERRDRLLQIESSGKKAVVVGEKLKGLSDRTAKLKKLIDDGVKAKEQRTVLTRIIVAGDGLVWVGEKAKKLDDRRRMLSKFLTDLETTKKNKSDKGKEVKRLETELQEQSGGICPICGSDLNE
jgi:chromosome segregation ATPase